MAKQREFDVVVYGATGFTGRLVVEYLVKRYGAGSGVRWAMAGRSADKLASVREEVGAPADTPLLVADASDASSLDAMVARTRVVLTTVGPYQLYGTPLVAACAKHGTDYVDLCGEPLWMHRMIEAHGDEARATGARIVFSCGFDSVPFDLGVWFLQQHAKQTLGAMVPRVKGRVRSMVGTFSGGTAASLNATLAALSENPSLFEVLINPFALTPGFEGPAQPPGNKPIEDEAVGGWVAPFIMASINTKNVHRSNFLMGHPYGRDFVYDEMMVAGPGDAGLSAAKAIAGANPLAGDDAPKPGEGPSRKEREEGSYDVLFIGESEAGKRVRVSVKGDMDPGYGSTSKMIAECALCLIQDVPDAPGGIYTSAPIFGDALITRLTERAGLTFTIE